MRSALTRTFLICFLFCGVNSLGLTQEKSIGESNSVFNFKELSFKTKFSFDKSENEYFNNQSSMFEISTKGIQPLIGNLDLNFDLRLSAASANLSYVEKEHADGYGSGEKLKLKEVKFKYLTDNELIGLEAGLINQKIQGNDLLVPNDAYLGARESITVKTPFGKIVGSATQARPQVSSYSVSNEKVDTENLTFFNENVTYIPFDNDYLNLKLAAGHHAYNNLNSSVAYNSLFRGNTILGTNERNAEFAYKFFGWNYKVLADMKFSKAFNIEFTALAVENNGAPKDKNVAFGYGVHPTLLVGNHKFWIEFNFTEIDSDVLPGTFMRYRDFKGNGKTQNLWVGYEHLKNLFEVKAVYQKSEINNPEKFVQSNGNTIQIQLSKTYEIF